MTKKLYKIIRPNGQPVTVFGNTITATYSKRSASNKNRYIGGTIMQCEPTGSKYVKIELLVKVPVATDPEALSMDILEEVSITREVISCFRTDVAEEGI